MSTIESTNVQIIHKNLWCWSPYFLLKRWRWAGKTGIENLFFFFYLRFLSGASLILGALWIFWRILITHMEPVQRLITSQTNPNLSALQRDKWWFPYSFRRAFIYTIFSPCRMTRSVTQNNISNTIIWIISNDMINYKQM